MAVIAKANISNALKVYYGVQKLSQVTYGSENRPALNMLPKDAAASGDFYPQPILYDDAAAGRSATFADAQTNSNSPGIGQFQVDYVANYGVVQIGTDVLLRMRNDAGSFMNRTVLRVDTGINALSNDIDRSLFRSGTGTIGRVANTVFNTAVLTLTEARDAKNFVTGQVLVVAATDGGANRAGTLTVSSVDRVAGTVTMTGDLDAGIAAIATNDFIYTEGDSPNGGANLKITGFDGWLTGSTTLFAQDRSDHSLLQGTAGTGSLSDIKKAITDHAALVHDLSGGVVDTAFISWTNFAQLTDQLEADVMRDPGGSATAGFQFVTIFGAGGPIKVVGAVNAEINKVYLLQMNTWRLVSMGPVVRINDDDGLMAGRLSTSAGLEVRLDSHANLSCSAPAKNGIITLS